MSHLVAQGQVALLDEVLADLVHALLRRVEEDGERVVVELGHPAHLTQDLLLRHGEVESGELELTHLRLHLANHRERHTQW